MQKIKIIVDSASDIPDEELRRYGIDMVGLQISIDGEHYVERRDMTMADFYTRMEEARELPTTSRVPVEAFVGAYDRAWRAGFTVVVVVTMHAGGSGTYESAHMAADEFFEGAPEAGLTIHLVDSRTFSLGYGYPVVQAAAMAQEGRGVEELLDYLQDFFSRAELYIACYSLEYAKRSGRISAVAAFAGELLGMRPIIGMIDGCSKIAAKVRGDKGVVRKLAELCRERCTGPEGVIVTASAAVESYGQELTALLERELGRRVPHYKVGAAIAINTGPRLAALCLLGPKRSPDARDQETVSRRRSGR